MSLSDVMLTAALTLMGLAAGAAFGFYLGRTEAPRSPERKPSETRRRCASTEDLSHDSKEKLHTKTKNREGKTDTMLPVVERKQSKTRSIQTEENKSKMKSQDNRPSVKTAMTTTAVGVVQGEVERAKNMDTSRDGFKEVHHNVADDLIGVPVLSESAPEKALSFKTEIAIPGKIVHMSEKKAENSELTSAAQLQTSASKPSPKAVLGSEDMPEAEKGRPMLRIKLKTPTALGESVVPENTTEANTNSISEQKLSATEGKEKPREDTETGKQKAELIAQAGLAEIQDSEKTPLAMTTEMRETQNTIEHVDSGPQVAQNDVPATWSQRKVEGASKECAAEKPETYENAVEDVGNKQEFTAMDTTQQAIHPTAEEEPKQKAEERVAAVAKQLPATAERAKQSPVVAEESSKKISVSPSKEQQKPIQKTSLNDLRHGFKLKRSSSKQKLQKK